MSPIDKHALAGIAACEERLAFALGSDAEGRPTFMELIRTDGCCVVRAWDVFALEDPPVILFAAFSTCLAAKRWSQLANDPVGAYRLERGYE